MERDGYALPNAPALAEVGVAAPSPIPTATLRSLEVSGRMRRCVRSKPAPARAESVTREHVQAVSSSKMRRWRSRETGHGQGAIQLRWCWGRWRFEDAARFSHRGQCLRAARVPRAHRGRGGQRRGHVGVLLVCGHRAGFRLSRSGLSERWCTSKRPRSRARPACRARSATAASSRRRVRCEWTHGAASTASDPITFTRHSAAFAASAGRWQPGR
jgi:hypothetical protein